VKCFPFSGVTDEERNDYFEDTYLLHWREFIHSINSSNPIKEFWDNACKKKTVRLHVDSPRWSSTVSMVTKAVKLRDCVKQMRSIVNRDYEDKIPYFSAKQWKIFRRLS